jgi:FAD/FMN-containing dehydrogenase
MTSPDDIAAALRNGLGDEVICGADAIESRYLGDRLLHHPAARPAVLVRPRTTAEVSAALAICHGLHAPLVAQGGRTGLAGGATPADGWVILSLERMRAVAPVDRASATVDAEAGAVLQQVQDAADAADMMFPLDIGGRGSCTIGGNIATNAGGNRVLRYGMMRDLVLGLEVVLADGTVLSSMNRMLKNNAGYDLKQLFIGSEGTLGVVTRAVLRVFARRPSVQTGLCAVRDYAAIVDLLALARARLGDTLTAFEAMWPRFYDLGTRGLGRRAPIEAGHGAYVLLESMGVDVAEDERKFQSFVEAALAQGCLEDAVIARSGAEARDLWAIRDSSAELQRTLGSSYFAFDVSLPVGDIGRFIESCASRLAQRWPQASMAWFGHVADANIHLCVSDAGVTQHELDTLVYDCVADFGGSISAEHGIGLLKRDFLDRSRSSAEIATMRVLKQALDPHGILNPGKVLPA